MWPGNVVLKPWQWTEKALPQDTLATGLSSLDQLLTGFPRGAVSEIFGPPSSGKASLLHAFLASATAGNEYCALIDASDAFDPVSAEVSGVELTRLLWVRCGGRADHALRAADLLIHGGGWGVVVLDLADIAPATVNRIPISYWYRFRRAVEGTPAALIVINREPLVRACATVALEMKPAVALWAGEHPNFRLLRGVRMEAAVKKPVRPQTASFETRALKFG